jgi:hypothetical protein
MSHQTEVLGSESNQPGDPQRDGEQEGEDGNPGHHPPYRELHPRHLHDGDPGDG